MMLAKYLIKVERNFSEAKIVIESISIQYKNENPIDLQILLAMFERYNGSTNDSLNILNSLIKKPLTEQQKQEINMLIARNYIDENSLNKAESYLLKEPNLIDSLYYGALIQFNSKKYVESIRQLELAFKQDKTNLRCLRLMGIAKMKSNSPQESANNFQLFFQLCPGDKIALNSYAEALIKLKQMAPAKLILEKSRLLDSNQGRPNYLLGLCQYDCKEYSAAEVSLKDSIAIEELHEAVFLLGQSQEAQSKFEEAKLNYYRSTILDPKNDEYLFNYGRMVEKESVDGARLKAKEIYFTVININPKYVEALLRLGNYYLEVMINLNMAQDYFTKVLDIESENSQALSKMLLILAKLKIQGNFKKFITKYNAGISKSPSLLMQLSNIFFSENDWPKKWENAAPFLKKLIELEKAHPTPNQHYLAIAKLQFAEVMYTQLQFEQSTKLFYESCEGRAFEKVFTKEQQMQALYLEANLALIEKDLETAMNSLQQSLRFDPTSTQVVALIAYIHYLWKSPRTEKVIAHGVKLSQKGKKSDLLYYLQVQLQIEKLKVNFNSEPSKEQNEAIQYLNLQLFDWKNQCPESTLYFLCFGQISSSRGNSQIALKAFTDCKEKSIAPMQSLAYKPLSSQEVMQCLIGLVKSRVAAGDLKHVMQEYETIMKEFLEETEVLNLYADLFFSEGDYSSAMHFSKRSISKDQSCARNFQIIGLSCIKKGQFDSAIPYLKKCRALSPETENVDALLMQAYEGCGALSEALQLALPLLSYRSNDSTMLIKSVNLLMQLSKYDEANVLFARWKLTHKDILDVPTKIALAYLHKRQNRNNEAIKLLEECVEVEPLNEAALFSLGIAYHSDQNFEKEITLFSNSLKELAAGKGNLLEKQSEKEAKEFKCRIQNNLGMAYAQKGEFNLALPLLNEAITCPHNRNLYFMNQGLILLASKQHTQALEVFEAQRKQKGYTIAQEFMYAFTQSQNQDANKAIKAYQKCLKSDPTFVPAAINLAVILRKIGSAVEAVSVLREQVEAHPNIIQLVYQFALSQVQANHYSPAIATLIELIQKYETCLAASNAFLSENLTHIFPGFKEEFLTASSKPKLTRNGKKLFSDFVMSYQEMGLKVPSRTMLNLLLARVYRKQNRIDNEIKHFENILRGDEQNPEYIYGYGSALQVAGKYKQALNQYEQALELCVESKKPMVILAMSTVYHHYADTNKEIKLLNQCLNYNPNLYKAHENLGAAFMKQKKHSEAKAAFLKSLEIAPNRADAHFNLGNNYMRSIDIENAIEQFNLCIELMPNHLRANFNLGIAHSIKNSVDLAINCFKKCQEIDIYNPEKYLDKLDKLYKRKILANIAETTIKEAVAANITSQ